MPRRCAPIVLLSWLCFSLCTSGALSAEEASEERAFLAFVQAQAKELRADDSPPASQEEWNEREKTLRDRLERAFGGFPQEKCELAPRVLGTLERDGYRVEKLVFQTRPGIWMTANAYVPQRDGKLPAVLCVHGHWRGAKQDPVVQSRCIGLVKLGFFVLVVDAFGAGERGIGEALGEYHGEMTGATLLPTGLTLAGMQVYENQRAVDYLATRPEVDAQRMGITGASGGGNQSMYAGAWDERFRCVTPVCSVGNYHVYLGAACCMCEMVPGMLRFTDQGDLLGLTVPRGLMIISATKDAPQFSVSAAQKSVSRAQHIAELFAVDSVRHTIVEAPHDYNREMREAMYGWMTLHLKGEGDGAPITEPEIVTEEPETLRCFPGESRPDDFRTIPQFAAIEARRVLAEHATPRDQATSRRERERSREVLHQVVLGGDPAACPLDIHVVQDAGPRQRFAFTSEPGIQLSAELRHSADPPQKLAVLLDLEGAEQARSSPLAEELSAAGWTLLTPELRATGALADPHDKIGNAPDHNTAEWAMWIGRPLLGQWVFDVRRALKAAENQLRGLPPEVAVIGRGPAGIVALTAAALEPRITQVVAIESLATYVTDQPYRGQRLGIMVPGILRDVGDVAHVAALVAPRRVVIAGGVLGNGSSLDRTALEQHFAPARTVYELEQAADALLVVGADEAGSALQR